MIQSFQEVGCHFAGKRCARELAASLVGVSPKTVGRWARDFETLTFVQDSQRGRHSKTTSPITDPKFREEFKAYVKENSRKSGKSLIMLSL